MGDLPETSQKPPADPAPSRALAAGWLNRTVLGIGLASLFSDVGHEMATAAMPALLASLGSSSLMLGLIEGVSDGAASFAKLFSGLHSDRLRRRKPLAVAGYFLTAAGMASFAVASRGWQVLAGRVVGWLGRGARTPVRNVLLTEATTKETYGRAFGLERAMDSAGAVVGPLIALAVLHRFGIRSVFAYTFIPGVVAALLIIGLVRERPHESVAKPTLLVGVRALPKGFRRFLIGVGIAGLGDFSNTLLILWATQAWTLRLGGPRAAALAMAFYVGYNVVYTLSCYVSGFLADHLPKTDVLAGGYALAIVPAVALLVPGASLLKYAVVFGVSGLYMGVWETVEGSTAATYLPAEVRGIGFGTLATVNGIGDVVASIVVGGLWVVSPTLAMSIVIATSLVGAGIILRSKHVAPDEGEGVMRASASVTICCATNVGLVRDSNEDTFVIADVSSAAPLTADQPRRIALGEDGVLLAVFDGMGGAAAGEVAARLARETISTALFDQKGLIGKSPESALMSALPRANQVIFEESQRQSDEHGMGTTCTAGLLLPDRLVVAQVGDSRAYVWRNGALKPLTRDQSLATAMLDAGALRPEELESFPHGNVILQALGVRDHVDPVITEFHLEPGDTLLLCSDGLHGPVSEGEIAAVLAQSTELSVCARSLIRAALDAGGPDNITVILAKYDPSA